MDTEEEAEVETLDRTSKIARNILKAPPLKEKTQKENFKENTLKHF